PGRRMSHLSGTIPSTDKKSGWRQTRPNMRERFLPDDEVPRVAARLQTRGALLLRGDLIGLRRLPSVRNSRSDASTYLRRPELALLHLRLAGPSSRLSVRELATVVPRARLRAAPKECRHSDRDERQQRSRTLACTVRCPEGASTLGVLAWRRVRLV